ncbi:MAG: pyridoxamine 5'-phosphate oxidase family protein [Betaproteobacteria bacterium]
MATYHPSITDEQAALIRSAARFFVASADPQLMRGPDGVGPVNVSPKGGVPLHIIDRNRVAYLDYRGSGNETARHCTAGGPITVMICSFEESDAAVVRLFGNARVAPLAESPLAALLAAQSIEGWKGPQRQVVEIEIDNTMTSCGYGVPVMKLVRQRRVVDRGRRYKEPRPAHAAAAEK